MKTKILGSGCRLLSRKHVLKQVQSLMAHFKLQSLPICVSLL